MKNILNKNNSHYEGFAFNQILSGFMLLIFSLSSQVENHVAVEVTEAAVANIQCCFEQSPEFGHSITIYAVDAFICVFLIYISHD